MNSFAFITHPEHEGEFKERFFAARWLPDYVVPQIMKACPAYRLFDITGVASKYNRVSGMVIASPLLTSMIFSDESRTIKKVLGAIKKAKKLGAKIIGLGNEFGNIEGLSQTISKEMAIPVTAGNTYRISALMDGLKIAAATKGLDLYRGNILISGAASSIGKICAAIVAKDAQEITLINDDKRQAERIAKQILYDFGLVVKVSENVEKAVKSADIIIVADDDFSPIDSRCFKPGAMVFDIFSSRKGWAKAAGKRNDVMAIEKIYIKVSGGADFNKNTGLPKDIIDSGMAEVLILALEKQYPPLNYSQAIQAQEVYNIGKLAQKHGFEVTGFLANTSAEGIKNSVSGKVIIPGAASTGVRFYGYP